MALDQAAIDAFIADHPDWQFIDGSLQREFKFADHYAAHDLANRLAHHAEEVDHHPDLSIGWRKLSVRLKTHDKNAITDNDTDFVEWIDSFFRIKEAAKLMKNPRPARELARVWGEAVDMFAAALQKLSPDDFSQPARKGERRPLFDTCVRGPVAANFQDLGWIRGVLELPFSDTGKKREDIEALGTPDDVVATIADLKKDIETTMGQLYEGVLADRSYLTELGTADIEQVINRAIVNLHRHRGTIEDYLAAKQG